MKTELSGEPRDVHRVIDFTCNLCGSANRREASGLGRETASCASCGSTVRTRGLARVLSLELFGTNLTVPGFPRVKSLRGLGISDIDLYASLLAEKFDYRNTFYDHAPQFDIMNPPEDDFGKYDFIISSEVFEHVPPPAEKAFTNACRLLKPNGVLILTVPYSIEDRTLEHYPDLYEYNISKVGGQHVLINRTQQGVIQIFENLVFHLGSGAALEMREFAEVDLMAMLANTGFPEIHVHEENYEPFGILYPERWSLPIALRRGPLALNRESAAEILDAWKSRDEELRETQSRIERLERSSWMRVGRTLGLAAK